MIVCTKTARMKVVLLFSAATLTTFWPSLIVNHSPMIFLRIAIRMTCDGKAHWYLSVKYTRDPSGAVSASQELYIDKILKRWGMESCKPFPTPFPVKSDIVLDELLKPIEHPDPVLNKQFQEIIGQLLYCQQQTVPEISWSVSILARFTTKAGAPHMALAKKVLRYLQGRKRIPLRWCARSCQQLLVI